MGKCRRAAPARWSSPTTSAACSGRARWSSADFGSAAASPPLRAVARESLAYRKRTQPLALPSAGCIFPESGSARDPVPDGHSCSAGALVDRAGLKDSQRRRARLADARQLHRQRRRRERGHPRADRTLQARGLGAVRRRAARRNCLARIRAPGAAPRGCGGSDGDLRIEGGRRLSGASRSRATRTRRCR